MDLREQELRIPSSCAQEELPERLGHQWKPLHPVMALVWEEVVGNGHDKEPTGPRDSDELADNSPVICDVLEDLLACHDVELPIMKLEALTRSPADGRLVSVALEEQPRDLDLPLVRLDAMRLCPAEEACKDELAPATSDVEYTPSAKTSVFVDHAGKRLSSPPGEAALDALLHLARWKAEACSVVPPQVDCELAAIPGVCV